MEEHIVAQLKAWENIKIRTKGWQLWKDNSSTGVPFNQRFPEMFRITNVKDAFVSDMKLGTKKQSGIELTTKGREKRMGV